MVLKIFGEDIPVKLKDLSGTDNDGYFDKETKTIYLHNKLKGEEKQRILFHESFHAMCFVLAYSSILHDDVEEMLAEHLERLIKDNFKLNVRTTAKPR